jgi:hypothetical protein
MNLITFDFFNGPLTADQNETPCSGQKTNLFYQRSSPFLE